MATKAELLKQLEGVEEGDFVLRTETEESEFRENLLKTELDKKIGDRIREVHTSYDNDIFETIGKKKGANEKTYDFMKREFKELKEKADETTLLEKQIKDLKIEIRDGSGDETLKKQLKALETKHTAALSTWTEEKATMQKTFDHELIGSDLDKSLARLKFRDDIPQAVIDSYVSTVRSELVNIALRQDGSLVFKNGEDGILTDNTTLKPIGADIILAEKLKDILAGDGKSGLGGDKDNEEPTGEIVPPDSALVSLDTLSSYLQEEFIKKGMTRNAARQDAKYIELFGKYSKQIRGEGSK